MNQDLRSKCTKFCTGAKFTSKVGINYGQLGNNLPSPLKSVELIKSLKAKLVKIYDTNPKILNSLKHTNIKVSIMLPNELISNISSNQTLFNLWVRSNVKPFYPHTKIQYLLISNEIISSTILETQMFLQKKKNPDLNTRTTFSFSIFHPLLFIKTPWLKIHGRNPP